MEYFKLDNLNKNKNLYLMIKGNTPYWFDKNKVIDLNKVI